MDLSHAIELIRCDGIIKDRPTTWADLGCGTGLFTQALAHFLQPGSVITAVDTNKSALSKVGRPPDGIVLEKVPADFVRDALPVHGLDGVLMANALHFVRDKPAFLHKAKSWLQPGGCFLVVEYDTDTPNPWVPCPVSFEALRRLFTPLGFSVVKKLREQPSIYHAYPIYSAWIGIK